MDSKQWFQRHSRDSYVHRAQSEGYRSRAAFKLIELDQQLKVLKRARTVVDLGATPGGWSQVAARYCHKDCLIIALDLLPMKPVAGVHFIQGDFLDSSVRSQLADVLVDRRVDLLLSDMSPDLSGIPSVDQLASAALIEMAVDFCHQWLAPSGCFVAKTFHGSAFQQVLELLRHQFVEAKTMKPKASRSSSKEVYLYAKALANC